MMHKNQYSPEIVLKSKTPISPEQAKIYSVIERQFQRVAWILYHISPENRIPLIEIKPTMLKYLEKHAHKENYDEIFRRASLLIARIAWVSDQKIGTEFFTAIFAYQQKGAYKIDQDSYSEFSQKVKDLVNILKKHQISPKSITGMQAWLWIPKIEDLEKLTVWCQANNTELKSITGMQHGLWIPKIEDLQKLVDWCTKNQRELVEITRLQKGIPEYVIQS